MLDFKVGSIYLIFKSLIDIVLINNQHVLSYYSCPFYVDRRDHIVYTIGALLAVYRSISKFVNYRTGLPAIA